MDRTLLRIHHFYLLGIAMLRKRRILASLKIQSFFKKAPIDIQWARAYRIGKNVRIWLHPGQSHKIRFGPYLYLGDDTLIEMRGGELIFEERVELRGHDILKIGGRFHIEGGNFVTGMSHNCMIHCGKSIRLGKFTTLGENTSLYDGEHIHTMDPEFSFYLHGENILKPIDIGRNCYIGARCGIMGGVTLEDCTIVGTNSVVTKDLPGYCLAAGIPAKVIKTFEPAAAKGKERRETA